MKKIKMIKACNEFSCDIDNIKLDIAVRQELKVKADVISSIEPEYQYMGRFFDKTPSAEVVMWKHLRKKEVQKVCS